jgi:hypothetical protein
MLHLQQHATIILLNKIPNVVKKTDNTTKWAASMSLTVGYADALREKCPVNEQQKIYALGLGSQL